MRILRLKLRGAIGIKKGLGVDEIEIDFTQFQAGLIALTGRNGSGKTTIMENLHPYRQMVSRDGSLQSHFFLKESFRVVDFEINGGKYESKILIDALTGTSEAYLFEADWEGNLKPVNDGKLTTYDHAIESLLGTPELFFNSVFSGQKSKGIAELKPADRRKLFYELLNLNSYEVYLETAKANLKKVELSLSETEGEIKAITTNALNLDEAYAQYAKFTKAIEKFDSEIGTREQEIETMEADVKKIEIKLHDGEKELNKHLEIKEKISSLNSEAEALKISYDSKMLRFQSDIAETEKVIERNKKLSENTGLIDDNIRLIERSNNDLQLFQNKRAELQHKKSELQSNHNLESQKLYATEKELSTRSKGLELREHEINVLTKEIDRSEKEAAIIENSNCDSPTKGSACNFLISAHANKSEIPLLKSRLESLISEFATLKTAVYDDYKKFNSQKQIAQENYEIGINKMNNDLEEVEHNISLTKTVLVKLNSSDWKKLKEDAREAETNTKINAEKITSLEYQLEQLTENYDTQIVKIINEVDQLTAKINNDLEKELTELQAKIDEQQQTINDLKAVLIATQELAQEKTNERKELSIKIELAELAQKKLFDLLNTKDSIQNEIREWTFLCKAFDKTGIPVLKLENSGIEITTIANELLSLFENKFRIVFETTSLTKDKKKMKETFDINIVEEDGVCEIGNKSGGQQVWLETAIQLSIMILLSQQGKKAETAFLDEKDGALDLDNAFAYIEMLKKAHQMSGVYNTFVITHRTELLDYIPQQVKLNNGILEIIN